MWIKLLKSYFCPAVKFQAGIFSPRQIPVLNTPSAKVIIFLKFLWNYRELPPSTSNMAYKCHVLVVGCGLSGLASALALAQTGHRVTVFERSLELQEVISCFSI